MFESATQHATSALADITTLAAQRGAALAQDERRVPGREEDAGFGRTLRVVYA